MKKALLEDIYLDSEWANSHNETDNSCPDFQLPDWVFLQRPYSETELQEKEASSSRVHECRPINNPFILSEASEERSSEKRRKENQNIKH